MGGCQGCWDKQDLTLGRGVPQLPVPGLPEGEGEACAISPATALPGSKQAT